MEGPRSRSCCCGSAGWQDGTVGGVATSLVAAGLVATGLVAISLATGVGAEMTTADVLSAPFSSVMPSYSSVPSP